MLRICQYISSRDTTFNDTKNYQETTDPKDYVLFFTKTYVMVWHFSKTVLILYFTRDDPKVLIFTLLCPETFLRGILCIIQKNEFLPF